MTHAQTNTLSPLSPAAFILQDAAPVVARTNLQRLSGKRILLTGASGLVGTYLLACLRHLLNDGHTGTTIHLLVHSEPLPYFRELADHPAIRLIKCDLSSPGCWQNLPTADVIIHAAGYGQPGRFLADPVKTIALNSSATIALFEHLAPEGRFLFISSSEIYSGLTSGACSEDQTGNTAPDHPRACYIEGKRCGETICHAWRTQGVAAYSARLALAYGPGARPGDARVLNAFIQRALEQGEITMLDAGLATRTYCYITDAIELLLRILLDGQQPVYNVGGESRTTIAGLAEMVGGILNVPVNIPSTGSGVAGAPADVSLDMTRCTTEFGKRDYVSLEQGLQRTVEWQRLFRAQK
jgi:UDP-glucuronate decarboxylase